MKRLIGLLLLISSFLGAEETEPCSQTLTLESAYRIALDNNPLQRAAIEGVIAANEAVGIARSPYYPDISLKGAYTRFRQFFPLPNAAQALFPTSVIGPVNEWEFNVNGQYIIYDFGKRRADLDHARAQKNIAKEEEERIQQQILLNVALAYYSLIANIELKKVAEETLKRAEEHYGIALNRYDAGDSPAIDKYRTQVEVASAKQHLVRARNGIRIASGNLNTAMGLPPQLEINVEAEETEATSPELINICDALESSMMYRPEARQAMFQIASMQSRIQEAKSAFGPKLYANGLYGKYQDVFPPWEKQWAVTIELNMPLFDGFRDVHNLRRTKHDFYQALAEYEEVLLNVRQDVWNAHSKLLEAFELIQATKAQVVDADESLRLAAERYKVGSSTLNDLLDSQTSFARSQADYVAAFWEYRSAEVRFQWAQGIMNVCVK